MNETVQEIIELLITITLFTIVLSFPNFLFAKEALVLVISSIILHELGHKFVAKHYGCWARFKASVLGLFMALLGMFFGMMMFLPGAVEIYDTFYNEKEKKWKTVELTPMNLAYIALGGVGVNIALIYIFLLINSLALVQFNILIGLMNMIPFSPFDGEKIIIGSKKMWVIALVLILIPFFLIK